MATSTSISSPSTPMSVSSYETALCIIPPQDQCSGPDTLRLLYDKAYERWPPHINLVYPFVAPANLQRAVSQIQSRLNSDHRESKVPRVTLDRCGHFKQRNNSHVFLCESIDPTQSALRALRDAALEALGQKPSSCNFHLTIGQSEDNSDASRNFLLGKADLLPALTFDFGSLAVLVRESSTGAMSRMKLWGMVDLPSAQPSSGIFPSEFWLRDEVAGKFNTSPDDYGNNAHESQSTLSRTIQSGTTRRFDPEIGLWTPTPSSLSAMALSTSLDVSSYNVLIDSEYPPARDRDQLLLETILSKDALADILVMQEVSDDFLSVLLANEEVQRHYPYTSHGPPSQPDIGPLPSLRNIVVLSKYQFNWEFVPFHRRHKGAVVAIFSSLSRASPPFVVAGVHLTCGLTDGSVAAKKVQINNLLGHLKRNYATSPCVVAGDFNIPTSRHTIDNAVKTKSISRQTARTLESIELELFETGLLDAWTIARVEAADDSANAPTKDLFEGEEGATFNPRENALAAATSGTSNGRPQRYDRILVRSQGLMRTKRFGHFGLPKTIDGVASVPSDHSGIRAAFAVNNDESHQPEDGLSVLRKSLVEYCPAPTHLSHVLDLPATLASRSVFPSTSEEQSYQDAIALIKSVLLQSSSNEESSSSDVPMVLVPVGSYALGVWTAASDIDCLCIGSISSKTFFRLAIQRIYRARARDVRIVRRVRANTGTMLELSVAGIRMDLQYCPAANIVSRWTEFPSLQSSDPLFSLPILSLRKLKPLRDLHYIQKTIPSMASFRLAYLFIKSWAIERGIYSAKFGYFGGTHITLMLSWVQKRLAYDAAYISAEDLITSFFHHYAAFDWKQSTVFDAFFHKEMPRYQRSAREPMAILGFHAPNSNIAHTATAPAVQVLVHELQRADKRLFSSGMTWNNFFENQTGNSTGEKEFLSAHEDYVKIDIQYWGRTLNKGRSLVGWVESRCISFVVDIHKALPHLSIRIWPTRFVGGDAEHSETYYHGCYLIGLSRNEVADTAGSKEDRAHARITIEKTFERFLTQVQGDGKNFDQSSSWVGVSLAKPSEVRGLSLDTREWGDDIMEVEPDSEDEDEIFEPEDEPALNPTAKLPVRRAPSPSSGQAPLSASKLRPASDVLNRLRWDPSLDPSDYIVGYEDRFLGAKETGLERWKTEQTDDEFIPQHRILYFKKKGDAGGEVVWERATRIDRVFGSGLGYGGLDIA